MLRRLLLGSLLGLLACATEQEAERPSPPPKGGADDFQGFGALRGAPREKKEPAAEPEGTGGAGGGGAAGGAAGKGAAADKGPSKEAVLGVLAQAEKKLAVCLEHKGEPGVYQVQLTLTPEGKIKESKPVVTPTRKQEPDAYADIPAGLDGGHPITSATSNCIARLLGGLKFPVFEGQPITFTYPVILKR